MSIKTLAETTVDDFGTMTVVELNNWYQEHVGYQLQVDDRSMSESELRELCLSYWEERTETAEEQLP